MAEKSPSFVVVDKRKFTAEGQIREGFVPPEPAVEIPKPAVTEPEEFSSAKVVTMPARTLEATADATEAADDLASEDMAGSVVPLRSSDPGADLDTNLDANLGLDLDGDDMMTNAGLDDLDEVEGEGALAPPRNAAEAAAQNAAYAQSSREMDRLLQQANPGMQAPGVVAFEHVIQSFYLSAIMAMGAGTEPGQKPRIDILGARQSIDMLAVLEEKTKGNLTAQEQELLQGITFELRMMFLELTNAISKQALTPPAGRPGAPGGLR